MQDEPMVARARTEQRGERTRWRIGPEAQGLMLVSAMLLAYGLAVLYSASALVAMNENHGSAFYLLRQLSGATHIVITVWHSSASDKQAGSAEIRLIPGGWAVAGKF